MSAPYGPIDDPDKYLHECTQIEPTFLQEEFVRLPADLAYWNQRYSEAYRVWLEAKHAVERHAAVMSIAIREQLMVTNKGRATISEVEQLLHRDAAYDQLKRAEIVAETEKVRLYGVLDALRTKREMVISLGAHIRAEMSNDPLIRQQRALDEEVRRSRANRGVSAPASANPNHVPSE